jgi:hypothetical protein
MSPLTCSAEAIWPVAWASVIRGRVSRTSNIRFHDAIPRCSRFVTHPNAIIGQESITR